LLGAPHEWRNLYADAAHAAIRERLKAQLRAHRASIKLTAKTPS
jgi:hypothetical protein